ncbi:hypothetical protein EDB19DRAFT_1757179 [Suillus lakei]|nr:hypothetical protein EDB19DRAFT_1757179 [Suillus lakei]
MIVELLCLIQVLDTPSLGDNFGLIDNFAWRLSDAINVTLTFMTSLRVSAVLRNESKYALEWSGSVDASDQLSTVGDVGILQNEKRQRKDPGPAATHTIITRAPPLEDRKTELSHETNKKTGY